MCRRASSNNSTQPETCQTCWLFIIFSWSEKPPWSETISSLCRLWMFVVPGASHGVCSVCKFIPLNRCGRPYGRGEGQWRRGRACGRRRSHPACSGCSPSFPTPGSTTWWEIAACHFFGCDSKILVPWIEQFNVNFQSKRNCICVYGWVCVRVHVHSVCWRGGCCYWGWIQTRLCCVCGKRNIHPQTSQVFSPHQKLLPNVECRLPLLNTDLEFLFLAEIQRDPLRVPSGKSTPHNISLIFPSYGCRLCPQFYFPLLPTVLNLTSLPLILRTVWFFFFYDIPLNKQTTKGRQKK